MGKFWQEARKVTHFAVWENGRNALACGKKYKSPRRTEYPDLVTCKRCSDYLKDENK